MEIKLIAVMMIVQLVAGETEPRLDAIALGFMSPEECKEQAEDLNKTMTPPKFTKDGKAILFETRRCSVFMESELVEAIERLK